MREKLKIIVAYIFRGWENEPEPPHPLIKFIPPFLLELLSFLIGLALLFKAVLYLFS